METWEGNLINENRLSYGNCNAIVCSFVALPMSYEITHNRSKNYMIHKSENRVTDPSTAPFSLRNVLRPVWQTLRI